MNFSFNQPVHPRPGHHCESCHYLKVHSGGDWSTEYCDHRNAPQEKMSSNFLNGRSAQGTLQATPEWCPIAWDPSRKKLIARGEAAPTAPACKVLCELCVKRGYEFCANVAATTPITAAQPATCTWTQGNDPHMPDTYHATCGAVWTFTEGGPTENNMRFCPGCGKPAEQKGQS